MNSNEIIINGTSGKEILIMVAVLLAAVVIGKILFSLLSFANRYKYQKRRLLTKAEARFFTYLIKAVGDEYLIFPKVRIADVVAPADGLGERERNRHFWRTSSKHIDFVLVDKHTMYPYCCVELNDKSHERRDRKERDTMVQKIIESAGIKMVWIPVQRKYNIQEIKEAIF